MKVKIKSNIPPLDLYPCLPVRLHFKDLMTLIAVTSSKRSFSFIPSVRVILHCSVLCMDVIHKNLLRNDDDCTMMINDQGRVHYTFLS